MSATLEVAPIRDSLAGKGTERAAWAARFFQAIDAMDAAGFAAYFTPNGSFRMGNAPTHVGREAIEAFVRGFFAMLSGLGHNPTGLWEGPQTVVSEGVVTYRTHDGQAIELGYLGVMEFDGELIRDYRAYIDPSPLMAALQADIKEG